MVETFDRFFASEDGHKVYRLQLEIEKGKGTLRVLTQSSFYRTNSYDRHGDSNLPLASTLTFRRRWSQDHADSYDRKQNFRASTFHPFAQDPLDGIPPSSALLCADTSSSLNCSLSPQEHHCSEGCRYGCHPSQTLPLAYKFVVELSNRTLAYHLLS
ncbi:myc target protein 1 homolog [Hypanus sabinus]|uniref:myc target protein 1 homolog n=1 Tax=Hypanus sabinus TaxID=79690 RepID=UPI0028C4C59B|nr:myc target protein 1 homolog [Hypanus sabinus]